MLIATHSRAGAQSIAKIDLSLLGSEFSRHDAAAPRRGNCMTASDGRAASNACSPHVVILQLLPGLNLLTKQFGL